MACLHPQGRQGSFDASDAVCDHTSLLHNGERERELAAAAAAEEAAEAAGSGSDDEMSIGMMTTTPAFPVYADFRDYSGLYRAPGATAAAGGSSSGGGGGKGAATCTPPLHLAANATVVGVLNSPLHF